MLRMVWRIAWDVLVSGRDGDTVMNMDGKAREESWDRGEESGMEDEGRGNTHASCC